MISRIGFNGRGALLVTGLLVATSGCGSTTVIQEAAINGLDVVQSGQTVVTVRAGHVQGSFFVEVDLVNPTLSVTFMNEDGQAVSVSGRSMDAQVGNEAFVTFTPTTSSSSPFSISVAAMGHSMIGRPILIELR